MPTVVLGTVCEFQTTRLIIAKRKTNQGFKKNDLFNLGIYIILGGLRYANLKGETNIEYQFSNKKRFERTKQNMTNFL